MKRIYWIIVLLVMYEGAYSREVNIGVHLNPAFTSPLVSGRSVRQEGLHVSPFRVGYNIGGNVNVKFKKISVELAANCIGKSISVFQRSQNVSGGTSSYRVSNNATGLEVPLLFNFLAHAHDKESVYDLYLVAGAAYELLYQRQGSSTTGSSVGSEAIYVTGGYSGKTIIRAISPVVGFKINAVLRNVGLIDYGITWHVPLQLSGPYTSEARYTSGSSSVLFSNKVYVYPAFFDVKLCYYILNFDKKGRKRYRGG